MSAKTVFFILISFVLFYKSNAQIDTTKFVLNTDTTLISKKTNNLKKNNPTVATLLSIFPGAGQAYNKQYWKIPVFYSLLIYESHNFDIKNKRYKKYLNAIVEHQKHTTDPTYELPVFSKDIELLTTDQLTQAKDKYRRSRDLSAVLFIAIYAFNIIDANVYANLSDFDVSDDLTISIKPEVIPIYTIQNQNSIGISLQLKF